MRDIAVTLAVFGSLPFILRRPWIGILVWSWLSFMNPHRMAWGFSTTLPFAQIVALTTLVAILVSREPKKFVWEREMVLMALFLAWMLVTTLAAFYPAAAWLQLNKVSKIFLMIFVAVLLINSKERLLALVWVITLSIGFFGVKGGIFTLTGGGSSHVLGPTGTFIAGNNEIGLALCMTIPLLYYLSQQVKRVAFRNALIGAAVLTFMAALGTQSRGAVLGLGVMAAFLWFKSRRKLQIGILIAFAVLVLVPLMPESWFARMATIQSYDQDASALGRLNSWGMAINLAASRLFGGGFETFQPDVFLRYAPSPKEYRDAHSIYFEVLGEHGFPGLLIFLSLAASTWFSASRVIRACKGKAELKWLENLMAMTQVSLVAYLAAGAFLGMAYFDYFYNVVAIVAIAKIVLAREVAAKAPPGSGVIDAPRSDGVGVGTSAGAPSPVAAAVVDRVQPRPLAIRRQG